MDIVKKLGSKKWALVVVVGPILVVVILGAINFLFARRALQHMVVERRDAIAYLSAQVLQERFNRFVDVGVSLATRINFRKLISEGKWEEAMQILSGVNFNFSAIDRIFIADPDGVLKVDLPEAIPSVREKNFAHRDWYQGVSKEWKPYVSEIYRRTAEPQFNVVAVTVPIKKDDGELLGILVLQLKLDVFSEWSKNIHVGNSGFIYFVDKKGQVAGHPKYPPQAEIVDFSSVPVVQKVLAGESGIGIFNNPIEQEDRLSAYKSIRSSAYQWGVVVQQPTEEVFQGINDSLLKLMIPYIIVIIIFGLSATSVYRRLILPR